MYRVGDVGEIVLVAIDAVGGRALIYAADMAVGTGDGLVCAVEHEVELAVVKVGGCPGDFAVALRAIGREAQSGVIRFYYLVVIFLVTVVAVAWGAVVKALGVATEAIGVYMRAIEGKIGAGVVIEERRLPSDFAMALQAIGGEFGLDVYRIGSGRKIVLVAVNAVGWRACIYAVDMAIGARDDFVRAIEGKAGIVVVEVGGFPSHLGVALQAVGWEAQVKVIGIVCLIVVRLVAVDAIGGRALVYAADMAIGTG